MSSASPALVSVLMVGAGEYCCGYVATAAGAAPDKRCGVVAVTLLDLRRRGKLGRILLAEADASRLPAARACMAEKIGAVYRDLDVACIECWPRADVTSGFYPGAAAEAMASLAPGDAVIIFTPDPTHAPLAAAAIARGLHVLVAKPLVKTLAEHAALAAAARAAGVLLACEYHKCAHVTADGGGGDDDEVLRPRGARRVAAFAAKSWPAAAVPATSLPPSLRRRWDPIYNDARERARALGPFSFFSAVMTQRRSQLDTFAGWAGKSSDISYYLNSHHADVLAWMVAGAARPETVTAVASTGVADAHLGRPCEDTITLLITYRNAGGAAGHAVLTASWVAPTADCHTQQSFHYMGQRGELRADQAHRGYALSAEPGAGGGGTGALAALNPLYMRYTPDERGFFAGQTGYGYRSIEAFVEAAAAGRAGAPTADAAAGLADATHAQALMVTAVLEAGRRSLDAAGKPVRILYEGEEAPPPHGAPANVAALPKALE